MFQTVIVPLDASRHTEEVVPIAADEARRHNASLVLLHVVPRPEPPVPPHVQRSGPAMPRTCWPQGELATASQSGRDYLDLVKRRHALPADTVTRVVVGEPARRIVAEAEAWPKSLVVMTSGDCADQPRPPLSEVARQLLLRGTMPVLAIRQSTPMGEPCRAAPAFETVIAHGAQLSRIASSRP